MLKVVTGSFLFIWYVINSMVIQTVIFALKSMVRTQGCTCTYEYSEKCSFVYFVLNVCHLLFHRKTFVLTSIVGLNLHMSEKVALKVSSDSQKTVSSKLPC